MLSQWGLEDRPFILVGNKCDLDYNHTFFDWRHETNRCITQEEGLDAARAAYECLPPDRRFKFNLPFWWETSALVDVNVRTVFEELVRHIDDWKLAHRHDPVPKEKKNKKKKKKKMKKKQLSFYTPPKAKPNTGQCVAM